MTPTEVFQQLVQKLYSSRLYFHLSETPFSEQILIRKKFLNARPSTEQTEDVSNFTNQILELQEKMKDFSDVIDILEKKLGDAEALALKG